MAGSIREKPKGSGRWELRVSTGWDPGKGAYGQRSEMYPKTKGETASRRQAEKRLAQLVAEAEAEGPNGDSTRFADLLDIWMEARRPKWSPLTYDTHVGIANKNLKPALGRKQIRALKPEDFDAVYASLVGQVSAARILRIHNVASSALGFAVKKRWIARNVAALAERPMDGTTYKETRELPPVGDVVDVLKAVTEVEPAWGRLFWVSLTTGARRGEVAGLQFNAFDPIGSTLTIDKQVISLRRTDQQKAKGERATLLVKGLKSQTRRTAKSGRVFPLTPETAALVEAQIAEQQARARALGIELDGQAFLFSDLPDCSLPWRPDRVTKRFIRLRNRANLPTLRLHDLRHLTGTTLNELGVDPATISYLIGHSRISTSMDLYVERVPDSVTRAAESLQDRLLR